MPKIRTPFVLLIGLVALSLTPPVPVPSANAAEESESFSHDPQAKTIDITADGVAMGIDYDHGVRINSLSIGGVEKLENDQPGVSELFIAAQPQASYTYASDSVSDVVDGIVSYTETPRNRWTAYRSSNSSDWIELDFGASQDVAGLDIDFFADAGAIKAPASYRVESWDGTSWIATTGSQQSPAAPVGNATNRVTFDKITTSKLRVHFVHDGSFRSGVTEMAPFLHAPVQTQASYTYASDSVSQVVDGIVSYTETPRNRWTAYRSPNSSDWIELDFGGGTGIDGIDIDFFADAGAIKAPASYRVESWDGTSWIATTGSQQSPAAPVGNATNRVTFDKITTSKLRVHFVHDGSFRSGVSEMVPLSGDHAAAPTVATAVGTGELATTPVVHTTASGAVISEISYGTGVEETWTLDVVDGDISVAIERTFTQDLGFSDQKFIGLSFKESAFDVVQRVEDGGSLVLLDADRQTNRFLSAEPLPEHPTGSWFGNTQYAIYSTDVDLIDKANESVLSVTVEADKDKGVIFSRDPNPESTRALQLDFAVANELSHPSGKYLPLAVFQTERFSAVSVGAGQTDHVAYTFSGSKPYRHYYAVAEIPESAGIRAEALSGMLNDVLRSSVIDQNVGMGDTDVSGMGPYETWWYSQNAIALQAGGNSGYMDTLKNFVRFIKNENYPIHGTGQLWAVSARQTAWYKDDFFDTYGQYVAGVAAIYQASGDEAWLREVAPSVRASLDWALARDTNANGLIESFDVGISQWDDQTQHGEESAYANIFMYKALLDWAEVEQAVFGDGARATALTDRADLIQSTLNLDVADGGFWSDETKSLVHTRDLAGAVRGDVAHVHDNATAVTFGVVDSARAEMIMAEYTAFQEENNLILFPAQRLNFTGGENTNPFPSYLNGNVFPQMTLEMMSAYVTVGEDERALDLLAALAAQYEQDELVYNTYNWDMSPDRRREPWFAANARPAAGFYTQLLGITPRADRLILSPASEPRLDGVQTSYSTQGHAFEIEIVSPVARRVVSDGVLPVELRWSGLEPDASYSVTIVDSEENATGHVAVADSQGTVSYTSTSNSDSTYTLIAESTWSDSTEYSAGDAVAYNGALWIASWWTQAQTPGDATGPWQEFTNDANGVAVWTASRIFTAGDQALHNGLSCQAKWWTRNQTPGDANGPWDCLA